MKIEMQVNGIAHAIEVAPHRRLLDVLREDLKLTGTKEGCGEGECGACTVLIDGQLANACLVAVGQVHGRSLQTIEGMAQGDSLHAIQRALIEFGGTQCGICTPGIALCAAEIARREPKADRARIRQLLSGNICRCTGYQRIVDAIAHVLSGAES